jgi:hypothetical protein
LDHERRSGAVTGWEEASAAMDRKVFYSYKRPDSGADAFGRRLRDYLRQDIADLEIWRETIASDEPVVLLVAAPSGAGKTRAAMEFVGRLAASRDSLSTFQCPQADPLPAGNPVPTTNWATSAWATLSDGTAPPLPRLSTADLTFLLPRTFAEAIPSHLWLRQAESGPFNPLAVQVQPSTVPRTIFWPETISSQWRPTPCVDDGLDDERSIDPELCEPRLFALLVRAVRQHPWRQGLLHLIDGELRDRRRELGRLCPAILHGPNVRSFALILIAAFRHYGHRSEPDDYALPAHRWMSVIGGEPALSC